MSDSSSMPSTLVHECGPLPPVLFVWNHVTFNEDAEMIIEKENDSTIMEDPSIPYVPTTVTASPMHSITKNECFHLSVFTQSPLSVEGSFADNIDIGRISFSGINHAATGMVVEAASELLENAANVIMHHFRGDDEVDRIDVKEEDRTPNFVPPYNP